MILDCCLIDENSFPLLTNTTVNFISYISCTNNLPVCIDWKIGASMTIYEYMSTCAHDKSKKYQTLVSL